MPMEVHDVLVWFEIGRPLHLLLPTEDDQLLPVPE
jgi:hypothetical protein